MYVHLDTHLPISVPNVFIRVSNEAVQKHTHV